MVYLAYGSNLDNILLSEELCQVRRGKKNEM